MLSEDEIKHLKSLPKDHAITLLRISLMTNCFRAFTMLCNFITVSASLKTRQKTYAKIFEAMQLKRLDQKYEFLSNQSEIEFIQAVRGIKSLSPRWSSCSNDDIFSLVVILDVNHSGYICWNDICLMGEMVYDSYRRNVSVPIQAYDMLFRNISQSLKNLTSSFCDESIIEKLHLLASVARKRGVSPLEMLEKYLSVKVSSVIDYCDSMLPNYSTWVAEFIEKLSLFINVSDNDNEISKKGITRDLFSTPMSLQKKTKQSLTSEIDSSRYLKNVLILSSNSTSIRDNLSNQFTNKSEDKHIDNAKSQVILSPVLDESMNSPMSVYQIAASPSSRFYENDSFEYSQSNPLDIDSNKYNQAINSVSLEEKFESINGIFHDVSTNYDHSSGFSKTKSIDFNAHPTVVLNTIKNSTISRGLFLSSTYPSMVPSSPNMNIFRSPSHHQVHGNVNTFDKQTFKWNPTKVASKYRARFQSHTDVLWAKKVNGVFDQVMP